MTIEGDYIIPESIKMTRCSNLLEYDLKNLYLFLWFEKENFFCELTKASLGWIRSFNQIKIKCVLAVILV